MPNNFRTRADPVNITTRANIPFTPASFRADDNSVEFILTTEEPAMVMDWSRFDVIKEILVSAGVILPVNKQIPLLNSHDRSTTDNIFGSVREIRIEAGQVVGRLFFASDEASQKALTKVKDGHIDSGSVGYEPVESIDIRKGEKYLHNGIEYAGPLVLTTKWKLKEFSLVAVGADPNAKARKSTQENTGTKSAGTNKQEANAMKMTFIQFCRAAGYDAATLTESQRTALELVHEIHCKDLDEGAQIPAAAKERSAKIMSSTAANATAIAEAVAAAKTAEQQRAADITGLCTRHNLGKLTADLIQKGATVEDAKTLVLAEIEKAQIPVSRAAASFSGGVTDNEKFRAAAVSGIIMRGCGRVDAPAPGADEFRGKTLLRLAEMCLERAGVDTRSMSKSQIATAALRQRGEYTIAAGTADFTSIVLDASNKSLQTGYGNPDFIWRLIARIGSAPDFKTINRIQLFESQDLKTINEQGAYTEAIFKDGNETYKLTSKGLRFTISRVAIINDDVDAFSRIPMLLGDAAGRTIERSTIELITGGIATTKTADNEFLFSAAHSNINVGSAFSSIALRADIAKMMVQKGRGADAATTPALVVAKFSLVPAAVSFDNEIACYSASDPTANLSSGAMNPILKRGIIPLSSPFLDLSSATRRYLLVDPNRGDSIEVSFLDGQDTPTLEESDQTDADGRVYKIRLDVGNGITGWRGLSTNAGA